MLLVVSQIGVLGARCVGQIVQIIASKSHVIIASGLRREGELES